MDFRPANLIFHDYGGSPANRDGVFNPYHALVFPDGTVRYRNPGNPYGSKAPHAFRMNGQAVGLSYAGPVGSKPTPQALAALRSETAKIAQMYPGIKPMSHGQAFEATKGTSLQASRDGRGLDEASWRSNIVYGPPAPGEAEVKPSSPTQMASRSLTAYAGLGGPKPQPLAQPAQNEAPTMPNQTGVPIPASYSPDTISAQRRMAMQLMQQGTDASPVQHWTQALARVLQGGMGGYQMSQADKQDRMMQGEGNALMGQFAGALTGGPSPAGMPPVQQAPDQAQMLSQALSGAPAPMTQEEQSVGRFASPGLAAAMPQQAPVVPPAGPVQVADAGPTVSPEILQRMLANPKTREMAQKYIMQQQRRSSIVDPKTQADIEYKKAQTDKIRRDMETPKAMASEGEKVLDRQFAKTYEEDIAGGRLADATTQLQTLETIAKKLENPGQDNYSGPYLGLVPESVRAFTNPNSVSVQNDIANIVQRSLRPILGAQFTQQEGENLIRRAYNPQLDEKTNAIRLRRLVDVTRKMAQQKLAAAQYFEQNGTLKGFGGTANFSLADIESAIDAPLPNATNPADIKSKYQGLE